MCRGKCHLSFLNECCTVFRNYDVIEWCFLLASACTTSTISRELRKICHIRKHCAVIMCHVMWILNGFTISICPYINIYMIDRSVSGLKSIYGILKSGSFPTAQIYDLLLVRVRVSVYVSDVVERRFKKWP